MKKVKTKLLSETMPTAPSGAPTASTSAKPATSTKTDATSSNLSGATPSTDASAAATAQISDYNGLPYETIITAWLSQHGIAGDVAEGARNTTLYQLARDMRYIMDFNVDKMVATIPRWGLSEAEAHTAIQSAVSSPRGTKIPHELEALLIQCQNIQASEGAAETTKDPSPLPERLPPLLDKVAKLHPRFPKAALLASLPALGTLLSNLRSRYADGQEQAPIFFTVIQAPQASGKSFARNLSEWLTQPLRENDKLERQKEQEYKDLIKRTKNVKELPPPPSVVVRSLPASTSNRVLLERADKAAPLALYTFAEEIDTIVRSNSAGAWSAKNDVYRMAFDGAEWGQDYAADNSYSAVVNLRYNLLFLGTPLAVQKFFHRVEDGMASRFMLAQLPDTRGEALQRRIRLTVPEQRRADAIIKQAYEEGCNRETTEFALPRTLRALDLWQMQRIAEFNADPDNFALDILRRRAGLMGFRAAMVAWWLAGKQETDEVVKFGLWVASEVLQQQLVGFGEEMNRIERESLETIRLHAERASSGRNARLLKSLPETFTKGDVIAARKKMGREGRPDYVISRWIKAGLVEESKTEKYSYRKINKEETENEKV